MTRLSKVAALFVCEGSSDRRLAPHLRTLLVARGADEATVDCPDLGGLAFPPGHDVAAKVRACVALFPSATLLFVHRDADGPSGEPRREEIRRALASTPSPPNVPVVPVQALEAWLLHDADAIVAACGRSRAAVRLRLPSDVERRADPKAVLRALVDDAQEGVSRRRRRTFEQVRAYLLEQLDPGDDRLGQVPSWRALADDITAALQAIA